jgi:hypothetical protein
MALFVGLPATSYSERAEALDGTAERRLRAD